MENKFFESSDLTAGQLNAIVKKLGGHDAAMRFLRGELIVSESDHKWREQDGIIYFSVTSDGTTGEEWITRLEKKGFKIETPAQNVLRSEDFKQTKGVTTEIAVLKGMLFEDNNRFTRKILVFANYRKFAKPNAEVACLIREMFTDKEIEAMGLRGIVIMHEPIKDFVGALKLLGTHRRVADSCLSAYRDQGDYGNSDKDGFAFVSSQVNSQI